MAVIPSRARDLLDMAQCELLEILHCVEDDVPGFYFFLLNIISIIKRILEAICIIFAKLSYRSF